MSKIFYIILAIIASISVIFLFSFCKQNQNSTIIESHQGHGGRGHPHGSGSRHGYGGGGGWWGRQYMQPIYLNPYSYGYGGGVNYNCRNGCINTGNGWGCQYPGWRATDCWFSSDCDGCVGGGRRGGWWF